MSDHTSPATDPEQPDPAVQAPKDVNRVRKPKPVFKGVWIPAAVWDSDLGWAEKGLWGVIDSLCRPGKPCFASDVWLSKRTKVSERRVRYLLQQLEAGGWLKRGIASGRAGVRYLAALVPESAEAELEEEMEEEPEGRSKQHRSKTTKRESIGRKRPTDRPKTTKPIYKENKEDRTKLNTATPVGGRGSDRAQLPKQLLKAATDAWVAGFEERFQEPYVFETKDGVGASRLLKVLVRGQEDPQAAVAMLMDTARAAWDHEHGFHCSAAATLAGFAGRFNDIRAELRKAGRLPGATTDNGGGW